MNREEFIKEQRSPENLKAIDDNIKIMSKLISCQSIMCKQYNLQKKQILQAKYKETKDRLLISPRVNKRYG
jgi:hypothetical protein